jgi:hypothetical protein
MTDTVKRNDYNEFCNELDNQKIIVQGGFTTRYDVVYYHRRVQRWPSKAMAEAIIKTYKNDGPLNDDRDEATLNEGYMRVQMNVVGEAQWRFISGMDSVYTHRKGVKRLNNQFRWYVRKEKGKYRAS